MTKNEFITKAVLKGYSIPVAESLCEEMIDKGYIEITPKEKT